MSKLTSCLSTYVPKVISLPDDIRQLENPVNWALNLFAANQKNSTLQIMKWARNGQSPIDTDIASSSSVGTPKISKLDDICILDQNDPQAMKNFIAGVQQGWAAHGRLELFNFVSDKVNARSNINWPFEIFTRYFFDEMKEKHPLGFHAACSLWLSSGEHTYPAHVDLQDAFLIHLAGNKRIKIWPTPKKYLDQSIFSHEDLEGRMASDPVEFDLRPGQIVFIPAGAVHEVVAKDKGAVVSTSFHMGSPYPLLILSKELNKIIGSEEIFLPEHMYSSKKDLSFYFQPSDYFDPDQSQAKDIPKRLADDLLDVLSSRKVGRGELSELLSQWWKMSAQNLSYVCPYPNEW